MSLYPALWGRVMDSIPPAHQQPRGLPYPLPTEDLSWEDRIPHTVILSNTDSICMEAKKHLRWLGHTIRMPEHRLPHQVLYSHLMGAKHSAGRQKRRFKYKHSPHAARISGTQQVSLAGHLCHWSFSNTPNQPRSMIRETHQETPVGGWYSPWYLFSLAPSVEECAAQGPDSTPTWSGTSGNVAEPYIPSHPPPWSKRHHRTR